jgi:hypothetical protein
LLVFAGLAGAFGFAADLVVLADAPLPAALLRAGAFLAGLLVTSTSLLAGDVIPASDARLCDSSVVSGARIVATCRWREFPPQSA